MIDNDAEKITVSVIKKASTYKNLGRKRPSFKNPTAPSLRDKSVNKIRDLYVYIHHRDIPKAG